MSAVFDERELLERIENDWDFLTETVQMLASDGRALMDEVRRTADGGDAAALARTSHTLKGMISNFCSPAAHASAAEVERIGRNGDLTAAPAAVKSLEVHLESLIGALNEFLATRT